MAFFFIKNRLTKEFSVIFHNFQRAAQFGVLLGQSVVKKNCLQFSEDNSLQLTLIDVLFQTSWQTRVFSRDLTGAKYEKHFTCKEQSSSRNLLMQTQQCENEKVYWASLLVNCQWYPRRSFPGSNFFLVEVEAKQIMKKRMWKISVLQSKTLGTYAV